MSFDRDGDAGTAEALEDALAEIAERRGPARHRHDRQRAARARSRPSGASAFRDYDECLEYIRESNSIKAPEGGVALPLRLYRLRAADLFDRSVQRALARPGARRDWRRSCARTRRTTGGATSISRRCCATRGASASTTRASRPTAPNAWTGSASRWRTSSPSARTSTIRPRWSACSIPRSRSSCSSSSPARPTRWSTTTTSSTRTTRATARKTRTTRTRA